MQKVRMRDMVVLLPGIMGSVLQKDNRDLWAISGQAIWGALPRLTHPLDELKIVEDDPDIDDLGDGVRAHRLMPGPYLIPGITKIDGYTAISNYIMDNFKIIHGVMDAETPANYFEFPYDWRRDNRVAARELKRLIDERLPRWREHSGNDDARVILLAHSMGGLVARHYLEVLEGWHQCKALITFGTPYRGSVKAVNYLANGYKKLLWNFTDLVRSFTSLYQLMPIYEMLEIDGNYQRIAETDNVPGVDKEKAAQALAFHREIERAVSEHEDNDQYQHVRTIPIVGTHQPTLQSASLANGHLTASEELPSGVDSLLIEGDSTVPRASATPIEMSDEYRETFIAEVHGSLQSNSHILADLVNRLRQMQVQGHGTVRGSEVNEVAAEQPAISVRIDDLYLPDESVEVKAKTINVDDDAGDLIARVQPVDSAAECIENPDRPFQRTGEEWSLVLDDLETGLYRIEVSMRRRTRSDANLTPSPVRDLFEVAR